MVAFVVRRVLTLVPTLLGMTLVLFVIAHFLPADPARAALGEEATLAQVTAYRQELGLDKPVWVQYYNYLSGLLHGDLGRSIISRRPVVEDLKEFFPATLELSMAAIVISALIGIPLGIASAVKRGSRVDHLTRVASLFAVSMPIFWLGLLMQLFLYAKLGWLPFGSRLDTGMAPPPQITGFYTLDSLFALKFDMFLNALKHLIMPALALSSISTAVLARITRSSMLDVLSEAYVTTARAKGLAERIVIYRHALKNASIPILTLGGMQFGQLTGGAILTETIFAWPGAGRYAAYSIFRLDFPAVMGFALVATLLYAIVNLAVDLLYGSLDPRIRIR